MALSEYFVCKISYKIKEKNPNCIHIHQLLTFSFLYYLPTCSKFNIKNNPPGLLHIALSALFFAVCLAYVNV